MRIVGGTLRGRRLPGVPGQGTRPTSDRVREAIASVLTSRGLLQDARVLDLYAGTGALGLEAISRGAEHVLAVDGDAAALRCIRVNAEALGVSDQVTTLKLVLGKGPARAAKLRATLRAPATLVFADPPYAESAELPDLLVALHAEGALAPDAALLIEHARRSPPQCPAPFHPLSSYQYGDTSVALWSLATAL